MISLGLFALAACNNPAADTRADSTETVETVGGQKDEHGCLTAAGQTWSALKQGCIQVFDVGQRLNPVGEQVEGATFSAFVVYGDDRSKVELFLPDVDGTTVIDSSETGVFENAFYRFDEKAKELFINGVKAYAAPE